MTEQQEERVRPNKEHEADTAEELVEMMKEWCVPDI